jgi:hypothetical protein
MPAAVILFKRKESKNKPRHSSTNDQSVLQAMYKGQLA